MNDSKVDLDKLPKYPFQFALGNLQELKFKFLIITIISIIGSFFGFLGTYLLSEVITNISSISIESIITKYFPLFLVCYAIKELFEYFTRKDGEAFATLAGNKFNHKVFNAILDSKPSTLSNLNKEELLVSVSRYIGHATSFISDWVWNISRKILHFLIIVSILASQNIWICTASLIYLVVFLLVAFKLSARFAPYAKAVAQQGQLASTNYTQSFLSSAIIRRLRLEDFFLGRIESAFSNHNLSVLNAQKFHAKRWLIQLNAFNLLYLGSLFYGIIQVKYGRLELGYLLLIRYAFERLWEILIFIIEKYVSLIQEKEESIILKKLLKPLISEKKQLNNQPYTSSFKSIKIEDLKINFNDSKSANKFSLDVPYLEFSLGERISLKSPSGKGKTTFLLSLINLVPYSGKITFDDKELQNINLAPELISYVSPSEALFPLSLEENISLGRNLKKEDLDIILNGLGINNYIKDSKVILGNENVNLSLGQAQRIRIARALVSKSPLLLLDESFTGLDPEAKQKIKKFICEYCKDSTIIVASHDPEDRLLASRHLEIEDGKLLEKIN